VRRLLVLASAIVFVDTMFFAAVAPLLPELSADLGLSKPAAGVLSGSFAAGALIGSIPGGWLAARVGVRPSVIAGLATMSVSGLVFALADDVVVLDAARFVQGLASAATWAGALAWLIGMSPPERRGEMIGTALAAAVAGALFGPVLGGAAAELGREPVFGSVAVLGVGLMAWALATPGIPRSLDPSLRTLFRASRDSRIRAGTWLILVPGAIGGAISVLVPLRMDDLGAGATAIAGAFLAAALLEAIVAPVSGRVSDRRGRLVPIVFGLIAAAVALPLFPLAGEAWWLAILVIVAAPLTGVIWSPAMALLSDAAEARGVDQALGFALVNLGWGLGQIAGSAGGARLGDAVGDAAVYIVLATLSAATAAALATRGRGRGRRRRDTPGAPSVPEHPL
jgi:predicted MFS family arabinose efflux permease